MGQSNAEILATVEASSGRRVMGLASLWGLGLLVLYLALTQPNDLAWRALLVVIGLATLWLAERMRRATALYIELTRDELRDSAGRVLCKVDDIVTADRGMFAFKPSNGFLITCRTGAKSVWAPGLWWRSGTADRGGRHNCRVPNKIHGRDDHGHDFTA